MLLWCLSGVSMLPPAGAQQGTAPSGAEDREAFRAARATVEPEQRLAALRQFATTYPDSALRPKATELALATALRSFPERTEQVHALAAQQIADAPAGLERSLEEARVADALASAEPAGADLAGAQGWAEAAAGALNEDSFRRETALTQRRYKLPPLSARALHRSFVHDRVLCLAALANVDLREQKPEKAEPLLAEAFQLEPLSSEVNSLEGQLALNRHQDAAALEAFERAEATGALAAPWHAQALRLYTASGGQGGEAGFERKIDALYGKLMPGVFTLPPRMLPAGGHTVLLELFTGSGCEPCVAPDLAVESLLSSYGRHDLAVLEYDENIPRPDPLTNPASENRAVAYRVGSTPEAFLDGVPLPVAGSARSDAENVVVGFASELENEAAQPSDLRLTLDGGWQATGTAGAVTAHAAISLAPGVPATTVPGRAVIHVALVQDGLRYSGENGIRFHRMVVRAMGPETVLRLGAGPGTAASQSVDAHFDLKTVEDMQRAYLAAYEKGNDRFGEIRFRTRDVPLDPAQLGVVVWVQDAASRAVLQAAFLAVAGAR